MVFYTILFYINIFSIYLLKIQTACIFLKHTFCYTHTKLGSYNPLFLSFQLYMVSYVSGVCINYITDYNVASSGVGTVST